MSKANISLANERVLHTKSGNRCAICKTVLVDVGKSTSPCIGENAHIYGEKPGSARYDSTLESSFVNSEKNLIFLCCNCHKKIDTNFDDYPPKKLISIKENHEHWVVNQLEEHTTSFTFAELEVLTNHMISSVEEERKTNNSFSILKLESKIKKNSLERVKQYITMGISRNHDVEEFLNKYPDSHYAEEITNIMAQKYLELKKNGLDTYAIFHELWDFTSGYKEDFPYKAAGLSVLTYFFEKCEVFEK